MGKAKPENIESEAMMQQTTQERSLVAVQPAELAARGEGMEEVLLTDLIVPRYRIVQPQSKDAIAGRETAGTFRSNLGVEKRQIGVCPLFIRRGQVYWPEPGGGDEPLCKSLDALKPDPRIAKPYNTTCNEVRNGRLIPVCREARWSKDNKPRCALTYTAIFLDLDDMTPFLMRFAKTAVGAVKMLLSRAWNEGKGGKLPLFSFSAVLSLQLTENKKGSYYVPVFNNIVKQPDELMQQCREAYMTFAAVDIDAVDADAEVSHEAAASDAIPF